VHTQQQQINPSKEDDRPVESVMMMMMMMMMILQMIHGDGGHGETPLNSRHHF